MSKEKPEVSDVWKTSFSKILIIRITKKGFVHCLDYDIQGFHTSRTDLDFIQNHCKYLGKSKVSIKELFDAAEDWEIDND